MGDQSLARRVLIKRLQILLGAKAIIEKLGLPNVREPHPCRDSDRINPFKKGTVPFCGQVVVDKERIGCIAAAP